MVDAQDAHIRAAARAALLDGLGRNVKHAHKADRPARYAACRPNSGAFLPQARKGEARAATGFMDQRGVLHRLEDLLHAIPDRQHEAGRKLPKRAAGVH
ncbi:hypothetical protein SDC9_81080 [bioreactor metagenome]|uniref:Uncharacterized protein n=1 Tax=bioreactor metagenome TaxID=1076179 RepID=A0A644Z1J9_9ZZZZ